MNDTFVGAISQWVEDVAMIVLVGFMGAGKTTIGYLLAEKLGIPFVDIDILIERRERRSVTQIFVESGEQAFRQMEHDTIVETLNGPDAVVALGGGAVEHPGTRLILESAMVVYLEVDYDEAVLRIGHDTYRPMMANPNVRDIYNRRLPFYRQVASLVVNTGGRRAENIVGDIIAMVTTPNSVPDGTKSVLVAPMGGAHQVHIGIGLVAHFAQLLPSLPHAKKGFIVYSGPDQDVASEVAESIKPIGLVPEMIQVPIGSRSKTIARVEMICERLYRSNAHSDDLLIGVGGESVCYLSGFVAATFSRGMKLALVPSTLFAQADSAIGGKNGINLSDGENMVGTIYQPSTVVSDVSGTVIQKEYEFRSGLAELIKHALIADPELVDILTSKREAILSADPVVLADVLYRSTLIKAAIVTADEREQGDRIFLNYGHTFGHAFEQLLPLDPDRHGDAVSLGMMAAAYLSYRQGRIAKSLVDLHRDLLSSFNLPTQRRFLISELNKVWIRNKKYRSGMRFILLNDIGKPQGGVRASEDEIAEVLDDLAK